MHKGHGVLDNGLKIRSMVPAGGSGGDNPAAIYAKVGLDAQGLAANVSGALGAGMARASVIRRSTGR
jgi:hypothetical protein